jgi:hypothetical protein
VFVWPIKDKEYDRREYSVPCFFYLQVLSWILNEVKFPSYPSLIYLVSSTILQDKVTERSEGSLSCMAYPLTKRERSDRIVEGFYLFLIIIGTK